MENPDIITQMVRHRKVVRHYENGKAEIFPHPPHQIDQLGLLH